MEGFEGGVGGEHRLVLVAGGVDDFLSFHLLDNDVKVEFAAAGALAHPFENLYLEGAQLLVEEGGVGNDVEMVFIIIPRLVTDNEFVGLRVGGGEMVECLLPEGREELRIEGYGLWV